ncbi:mannose-1-phosphate guanylyltransferase [Flavobacterium cyanobacteriorum]|uniref:Mannose-1-phosphate guanylyltransferase n=1 Tax=Flavobacterium cyanobacteriorum TaxID=2022802 RepID=A0A255YSC8_9FLAO|nr:mannose-1-phosphate guanylyltransferase [Flavobacterium cyanobacteriorum]OYQ32099.1 mannose-1-phosphate guanylyltransferase [Flavobacterium cyanobacteriorum]
MSNILHVILTGGVGSRLWPLSRKSKPKQYLNLFQGKSLFEMTLERNFGIASDVVVVGNTDNRILSEEALEKAGVSHYHEIVESTPRNTAAAIAFAAFEAESNDILVVTPSDHIINGIDGYRKTILEAIGLASEGYLVTFGINPLRPETGYGYIEYSGNDVVAFHEKPDLDRAKQFLTTGRFLWNSGMFCFKAGIFLEELKQFEPEIYEASKKAWENMNDGVLDLELSLKIPSQSVDYAVMERSKRIKVIPASFDWSDLGSFEAIYDYLKDMGHTVDEHGNMIIGTDKYTVFLGLKNTIFISTDDANLILNKENAQDVKKIYALLEQANSHLLN